MQSNRIEKINNHYLVKLTYQNDSFNSTECSKNIVFTFAASLNNNLNTIENLYSNAFLCLFRNK